MTVKKVELHNHLEGTAPPSLIQAIANRNKVTLRPRLFSTDGTQFVWRDFNSFLSVYEEASRVIQYPLDYYDITFQYLKQCANEEVIYVEMMYSPEHAERATKIPSSEHVKAIDQAIDDAYEKFGIIGRIIYTAVRHYGVENCEKVARLAEKNPSPYLVGFGLGGNEIDYPPVLFQKTYDIARASGLGLTAHAGEWTGPEGIVDALNYLKVTRLGHGVRSVENPALLKRLLSDNIHLELCPSSNIALGLHESYDNYPFKSLYDLGLSVSLNSDDPPYFKCTVGGEYHIAQYQFGLTEADLNQVSLMAIDAAFCDKDTKNKLKAKLNP